MNAAVGRRLLAEFTGTGLLAAIVAGASIAATRLTTDGALRLLVNSLVTAMGLLSVTARRTRSSARLEASTNLAGEQAK